MKKQKLRKRKFLVILQTLKKRIDIINKFSSPWKVNYGTASYEFIDDYGISTGKIALNLSEGTKKSKTAYEYVTSLKNMEIVYTYNKIKVSYDEILDIVKKNPNINMSTNIKNNKGTVDFWTKE